MMEFKYSYLWTYVIAQFFFSMHEFCEKLASKLTMKPHLQKLEHLPSFTTGNLVMISDQSYLLEVDL